MSRSDDPNDYVVHDPLLGKGKEKFNRMQAKQQRREREWAGKSLTWPRPLQPLKDLFYIQQNWFVQLRISVFFLKLKLREAQFSVDLAGEIDGMQGFQDLPKSEHLTDGSLHLETVEDACTASTSLLFLFAFPVLL